MEPRAIPTQNHPSPEFRPFIRPTPRAFILRGGMLLVQEKLHPEKGLYYTLPGGRQDPGETLPECLKRECREEVGADVTVGSLLHVAEVYRFKAGSADRQHRIDFVFACSVPEDYTPVLGSHPDPHQTGTRWITAENSQQLRPAYVTKLFPVGCTRGPEVYLGPEND